MSTSKEKHPSWFKMKLERRTMVKQLKPRVAVNVLLACWEFLETGEKPTGLSPIESIAFSAFMKNWRAALITWEKKRAKETSPEPGSAKRGRLVVGEDGEEAAVFDA